jgi:hypothetical protein
MVFVQLVEENVNGFREIPYGDSKKSKAGRVHVARLSRVPEEGERHRMKVDDGDRLPTEALFVVAEVEHLDSSMLRFVPASAESFAAVVKVYRLVPDAP